MHAKTREENIHAIPYLPSNPVVVFDRGVRLRFPTLVLPSFSKSPSIHRSDPLNDPEGSTNPWCQLGTQSNPKGDLLGLDT